MTPWPMMKGFLCPELLFCLLASSLSIGAVQIQMQEKAMADVQAEVAFPNKIGSDVWGRSVYFNGAGRSLLPSVHRKATGVASTGSSTGEKGWEKESANDAWGRGEGKPAIDNFRKTGTIPTGDIKTSADDHHQPELGQQKPGGIRWEAIRDTNGQNLRFRVAMQVTKGANIFSAARERRSADNAGKSEELTTAGFLNSKAIGDDNNGGARPESAQEGITNVVIPARERSITNDQSDSSISAHTESAIWQHYESTTLKILSKQSPSQDAIDSETSAASLIKVTQTQRSRKAEENQDLWKDILLQTALSIEGDSMIVNWVFNSNDTQISGFEVSYRINSRESYDSSRLGRLVRSFTLHSLHRDEEYVICVHAIVNDTAVKNACTTWSESSLKMVIGMLAGSIFLIPCVVIIFLILYKDHKVRYKYNMYDKVLARPSCEKQLPMSEDTHQHAHHTRMKKKCKRISLPNSTASSDPSLSKALHDRGHENPCSDDDCDDSYECKNEQWETLCEYRTIAHLVQIENNHKGEPLATSTPSSIPKDSLTLSAQQLQKDHAKDFLHKTYTNTKNQHREDHCNGPQAHTIQHKPNAATPPTEPPTASAAVETSGHQAAYDPNTPVFEQSNSHPGDPVLVMLDDIAINTSDETKL